MPKGRDRAHHAAAGEAMNEAPDVLERVDGTPPGSAYWAFWCPGCRCSHRIATAMQEGQKWPVWQWNGDPKRPTVTPSILVRHGDKPGDTRCHLYITNGQLIFLSDSTHPLRGTTVPMEPV
jgi:hypothetical protein